MALLNHNSREEIDQHHFHPAVMILVPLLAIFLQAYLPLRFPRIAVLDLPLIVTVYFAVSRRNPITGMLQGTTIGLLQDALTHLPLGINGIIKAVIGYLSASIGMRIDVENPGTRIIMLFVFTLLDSVMHLFIVRRLLGLQQDWYWLHELIRAVVNALIGIIVFTVLDRTRQRE